jgi:SpoVK/Ycf46/Vps4 family AAA+-type ATPase
LNELFFITETLSVFRVKVRASEVFNQWLGGSEAIIRSIFSRARAASPCILFFDELDALAVNREGGDSDATSGVQSRILTTLLNEMDGITNVGGTQGVLVVAATNRLDAIDAALLRPGRLEEHVLLSYPKSSCIHQILTFQTAKMPVDSSVDLMKLSDRLEGSNATCAEIEGVCRDACMIAIRRCSGKDMLHDLSVTTSDFDEAIHRIKRGIS